MRCSDDHGSIDNAPVHPIAAREMTLLLTFVMVIAAVVALDAADIQIVGYVLYPIEKLLNAALFPNAVTPLRGNGTASVVLVPTLLLIGVVFYVGDRVRRFARRIMRKRGDRRW